jgi:hypothetical protein
MRPFFRRDLTTLKGWPGTTFFCNKDRSRLRKQFFTPAYTTKIHIISIDLNHLYVRTTLGTVSGLRPYRRQFPTAKRYQPETMNLNIAKTRRGQSLQKVLGEVTDRCFVHKRFAPNQTVRKKAIDCWKDTEQKHWGSGPDPYPNREGSSGVVTFIPVDKFPDPF